MPIIGLSDIAANLLSVKSFDLAFYFNHQGIALSIQCLSGRDPDPSLADAVFIDIKTLFIVKLDTNIVLKNRSVVMRAARID